MPIAKVFHARNEAELGRIAADLAAFLPKSAVLSLEGDLGAGKTALARAIIRHMTGNADLDVPSPTYTLVQTYDAQNGTPIWHFDFYRLKDAEEAYELGWEDALASDGILILEWAQKIAPLLPQRMLRIAITPQDDGTRNIEVST